MAVCVCVAAGVAAVLGGPRHQLANGGVCCVLRQVLHGGVCCVLRQVLLQYSVDHGIS